MSTLSTLEESEYLKTTSTSKKMIEDAQDAQKNCVSALVNTFEKDSSSAEEKSRKICPPDFKNADERVIEPVLKSQSLVGFDRNRRKVR